MNQRILTYQMTTNGITTDETVMLTKDRTNSERWELMKEIITELRNFESRYATKINKIHFYYINDYQIEEFSHISIPKQIKAEIGIYMDDTLTKLYPYIIKDHMFFLDCSKQIDKYEEMILSNILLSKKGLEITNNKLSNIKFIENASKDIINNEKLKQIDFNMRWMLWSKAYLLYDF